MPVVENPDRPLPLVAQADFALVGEAPTAVV
jgi:hypothetical protein